MSSTTVAAARQRAREVSLAGLLCALGVVLPQLFHLIGQGSTLLPMHMPALLAGLLLPPATAVSAAVMMPWVSMGLTGMPPLPFALLMTCELGVLALAASLLRRAGVSVWVAAAVALLLRIAATFGAVAWLSGLLGLPKGLTASVAVVSGLPGVVLQVVVAPAVALAVLRRSLSKS